MLLRNKTRRSEVNTMMKKTPSICTLSIFSGIIALVVASFRIQVPSQWLASWEWIPGPQKVFLATWILFNVALPLSFLAVALTVLHLAWLLVENLCDWLQSKGGKR